MTDPRQGWRPVIIDSDDKEIPYVVGWSKSLDDAALKAFQVFLDGAFEPTPVDWDHIRATTDYIESVNITTKLSRNDEYAAAVADFLGAYVVMFAESDFDKDAYRNALEPAYG